MWSNVARFNGITISAVLCKLGFTKMVAVVLYNLKCRMNYYKNSYKKKYMIQTK